MSQLHDTLTATETADLRDFLDSYDAERDELRRNPYRPIFGQSPANILFTDSEDTAGQPDGYYFRAQGQEPPQESQRPLAPVWGYCFAFIFVGGTLALLWAFFGYFWPMFVKVYVEMSGV
jgi:hypothetical protein